MRLPRMTTRRWMVVEAIVGLVTRDVSPDENAGRVRGTARRWR
jgi:hypothetical protein